MAPDRDESLSPQALMGMKALSPQLLCSPSPLAPPSPTKLASGIRPPDGTRASCRGPPPPLRLPPPPGVPEREGRGEMWEDLERGLVALLPGSFDEDVRVAAQELGEAIQLRARCLRAPRSASAPRARGGWSREALRRYEASLRERCRSLELQCAEARQRRGSLARAWDEAQRGLVAAQELHGRLLWSTAARRSLGRQLDLGLGQLEEALGERPCRRLEWDRKRQDGLGERGEEDSRGAPLSGEPEPEALTGTALLSGSRHA